MDKYINELTGPQHYGDAYKKAQFAKLKRAVGARYILTALGMETGWVVSAPGVNGYFTTEQEAKDFAAKKGVPAAVYPQFEQVSCPFGTVIVWSPFSDYGPDLMTVEEFNAEWGDHIPSPEEMLKIKEEQLRRAETAVTEMTAKLNITNPVTTRENTPNNVVETIVEPVVEVKPVDPIVEIDDTFTDLVDPIAPDGPNDLVG